MAADPTELDDLAGRHPERVEAMAKMWERWAAEVGVEPPGDLKLAREF